MHRVARRQPIGCAGERAGLSYYNRCMIGYEASDDIRKYKSHVLSAHLKPHIQIMEDNNGKKMYLVLKRKRKLRLAYASFHRFPSSLVRSRRLKIVTNYQLS